MRILIDSEQSKKIDLIAEKELKILSIELMENASKNAVNFINNNILDGFDKNNTNILILCGSGNNGGDGFAIARLMTLLNYKVTLAWIGSIDKMSFATSSNYSKCLELNIITTKIENNEDITKLFQINKFEVIIDALIGTGGSENIKGIVGDILDIVDKVDAIKIAIDSPTGFNVTTGNSYTNTFKANYTITMVAEKLGMLLTENENICGKVEVVNIGFPSERISDVSNTYYLEDNDLRKLLKRSRNSSKFDYGKVLIIAGSNSMPGAAALCSNSAIKSGAGLVYLASTDFHPSLKPEVIKLQLERTSKGNISYLNKSYLLELAEKCSSIVIGPGIGDEKETIDLIKELIVEIVDKPIILDADGLKAIDIKHTYTNKLILTPHCGEFGLILDKHYKEVIDNSIEYAKSTATKLGVNILLKSVPALITNGDRLYINKSGNPGMATAGSGDVLSGIIGAFACIEKDLCKAGALAAYIHGKSGDYFVKANNMFSLTASDLIEGLSKIQI